MRINPSGQPGIYTCDKSGKPQLKDVYCGHSDYQHLCPTLQRDHQQALSTSRFARSDDRMTGATPVAMTEAEWGSVSRWCSRLPIRVQSIVLKGLTRRPVMLCAR